jgi:predicted DNA-binding transcriptional regulator AlpA
MPTVPSKPTNSVPTINQPRPAASAIDSQHEAIHDEARLLTEHEVANLLTLSIKTVRNWRLSGFGPPHLKLGRLVRYRVSDVKAWLKTRERTSTSDWGGDHA